MKSKNGYTMIELVVIIFLLGIATLLTTTNITKNFEDNSEDLYESNIVAILARSRDYGIDNSDEVKDSDNGITITVNKLIVNGYIIADKNGDLINPLDKKNKLNDLKIHIKYDEETNTFLTEMVE